MLLLFYFFFFFFLCLAFLIFFFFFFFSSRRRHTRLTCDWSSDVCSSDLAADLRLDRVEPPDPAQRLLRQGRAGRLVDLVESPPATGPAEGEPDLPGQIGRASCRERV